MYNYIDVLRIHQSVYPLSLLTAAVKAIIDVDLLGFVYHWGLEINGITVVGEICSSGVIAR